MKKLLLFAALFCFNGIAQSQEIIWSTSIELNYMYNVSSELPEYHRKIQVYRDTTLIEIRVDTLQLQGEKFTANDINAWKNSVVAKGDASISGTISQSEYTVTHGLGYAPNLILIQPRSQDATLGCWVHSITSNTFKITFISVPNTGTNNILFDWVAYK